MGIDLTGQRVLLVGGAGAMGRAIAAAAQEAGAEVALTGRSQHRLDAAAAALGTTASTHVVDFADAEQVRGFFGVFGSFDHLVSTAGTLGTTSVVETTPQEARALFDSKFWTAYHAVHFGAPQIRTGGSIMLTSGSSSRRPVKGYAVYGTVHGALEAFVRNLSVEVAPIRVNAFSPGGIGLSPDRQLVEHQGRPENVADVVVAVLANPAMTGAIVDIDCGERLGTWPAAEDRAGTAVERVEAGANAATR